MLLTGLDHQKLAPVSTQGLQPSYRWVSFLSVALPFLGFSHCGSSRASTNRTGIPSAFPELCNPLFLSSGIFTLCLSSPSSCFKLTILDPSSSDCCVFFLRANILTCVWFSGPVIFFHDIIILTLGYFYPGAFSVIINLCFLHHTTLSNTEAVKTVSLKLGSWGARL